MEKDIIYYLLLFLIGWGLIFPIVTVSHEIGHAIMVIIFTKENVLVQLGNGQNSRSFKLGRVNFKIGIFTGFFGFYRYDKIGIHKNKQILIYLGGPLFSLLSIIVFYYLSQLIYHPIIRSGFEFVAISALYQFIFTIIPIRYPKFLGMYGGVPSDGLSALKLIKN